LLRGIIKRNNFFENNPPNRGIFLKLKNMVQEKKFYLTKIGLEKIKKEYDDLRKLKLLKTKGESPKIWHSEDVNPEYLSFQEDLSLLETRIAELEYILKNVELIRKPPREKQKIVNLGATVTAEIDGEIDEFTIVGTLEADPSNSKISDESPIGRCFLGKKVGETAVVKTSLVNHSCKITKIKYNKI
jgi:transcription elongation factor GreA